MDWPRAGQHAQFAKRRHRLRGERHNVFALAFSSARQGCATKAHSVEILEFRPSRRPQFGCAGKGKDHQPQGEARSRIAIVSFECAKKIRHLVERHRLVTARSSRRTKGASQGRGGISFARPVAIA